jgi:hypothetical protein
MMTTRWCHRRRRLLSAAAVGMGVGNSPDHNDDNKMASSLSFVVSGCSWDGGRELTRLGQRQDGVVVVVHHQWLQSGGWQGTHWVSTTKFGLKLIQTRFELNRWEIPTETKWFRSQFRSQVSAANRFKHGFEIAKAIVSHWTLVRHWVPSNICALFFPTLITNPDHSICTKHGIQQAP